jgi:hypothetical protein
MLDTQATISKWGADGGVFLGGVQNYSLNLSLALSGECDYDVTVITTGNGLPIEGSVGARGASV